MMPDKRYIPQWRWIQAEIEQYGYTIEDLRQRLKIQNIHRYSLGDITPKTERMMEIAAEISKINNKSPWSNFQSIMREHPMLKQLQAEWKNGGIG